MTNMQLGYTEYLEDRRHNIASETNQSRDIDEKIRHDVETEKISRAAQDLDRYLGELNAQVSREKMLSDQQIARIKAESKQAIAAAKLQFSEKQLAQEQQKLDAQIDRMRVQNVVDEMRAKSQTEVDASTVAKNQAVAYGTFKGMLAQVLGPTTNQLTNITDMKNPDRYADLAVKTAPTVAKTTTDAAAVLGTRVVEPAAKKVAEVISNVKKVVNPTKDEESSTRKSSKKKSK